MILAYIGDYIRESINEGEFLRNVIYISGCKHKCKGCFSPKTWNFKDGVDFTKKVQYRIIDDVKNNSLVKGITICGGDSFFSPKDMVEFVSRFKKELPNHTIWCYTGFTFEQIIESDDQYMIEYLKLLDVLIDGRFDEKLKDLTLRWAGSSNQRVILVQESIRQGKIVLY